MKTLTQAIILFSMCVLFSGCPYESEVPIDKPSVKINSKLLGKWDDINNHGDKYEVSIKDEFTYSIEHTSQKNKESEKYLAYASIVNGTTFLNLWKIYPDNASHSYSLFKMNMKTVDTVTVTEVTENIDEKFASSEELKKFITSNMKISYFYGKNPMELVRSGK
jgi:hypothetical protein